MGVEIWTVIGGIFAVLAVVVSVVLAISSNRKQFPKRELRFDIRWTSLVDRKVQLDVSFEGVKLDRPHLVEVSVASNSRADIPTSAFDSSNPIRLEMAREILATTQPATGGIQLDTDGNSVLIQPQLIRSTGASVLSVLMDGPPGVIRVENSLIDIEVLEVDDVLAPSSRSLLVDNASTAVGITGLAVIAGILLTSVLAPGLAAIGLLTEFVVENFRLK